MARCFLTGVQIKLDDAYLLDVGAARRLLRELSDQMETLQRLLAQLAPRDEVTCVDHRRGGTFVRRDRRLVSSTVASALATLSPDRTLFLTWPEWRSRKAPHMALGERCTDEKPNEVSTAPMDADVNQREGTLPDEAQDDGDAAGPDR